MSAIAEPFLEVTGLHVRYSELVALRDVSLTVVEGEVVCIIGPNGAGKSTLLAAIAGGVAPSRGMIRFRGQNIVDTSPEKIARLGLSLVPEGRHIFGSLTVEENLLIGASRRGDRREAAKDLTRVYDYFAPLRERRANPASRLSGGEQQMLAIARALMSRPRLLLLDEPSLGLAPLIVKQIFDAIQTLNKDSGLTVFLVEQNAYHALKLAHRGYVMVNGLITLSGTGRELLERPEIKEAYLEGGRH